MKVFSYQKYPYTVYKFEVIDSTNNAARREIERLGTSADRLVFVADEQTEGRGRNGREWLNSEAAVMMSIVRTTKLSMDRMPILNLVAALAVKDAVKKLTNGVAELSVKWPNDLITKDRLEKVCGILSETVSLNGTKFAILGIGLNLNAKKLPDGLLQPASSVYLQYGKFINVIDAVNAILAEFEVKYNLFMKDQEAFLKEFASDCVSIGHHVSVDNGETVRYGVGDKLAKNGQLIVRYEDGETDVVYAADVSVRNQTLIDDRLALRLRPKREPSANKGAFGKAALIVGSEDMPGAALMSTLACIRSGAGLTRVLVPDAIKPSFTAVPEAMILTDDEDADELIKWSNAILIGCGMGTGKRTLELLKKALESKKPCVIDADGLNTLAKNKKLYELLHDKVVLTPHPAEMARLTGEKVDHVVKYRTRVALDFAKANGVNVLLKSDSSVLASPDGTIRYNDSGSSALAKGGSGDVLAGIITAFIAQGVKPYDAASLGAYVLGLSAEKSIDFLHNRFVAASDIIEIVSNDLNRRNKQ